MAKSQYLQREMIGQVIDKKQDRSDNYNDPYSYQQYPPCIVLNTSHCSMISLVSTIMVTTRGELGRQKRIEEVFGDG